MTRWEYLFLTVARGANGAWKVRTINGEEIPRWKQGPGLYEFCNDMGEQGWELVEMSHAPVFWKSPWSFWATVDRENLRVVLKRPKTQAGE